MTRPLRPFIDELNELEILARQIGSTERWLTYRADGHGGIPSGAISDLQRQCGELAIARERARLALFAEHLLVVENGRKNDV